VRHVETEGAFLAAGYDHLAGQSGPKNDDAEDGDDHNRQSPTHDSDPVSLLLLT
jgi:hypothetical protein